MSRNLSSTTNEYLKTFIIDENWNRLPPMRLRYSNHRAKVTWLEHHAPDRRCLGFESCWWQDFLSIHTPTYIGTISDISILRHCCIPNNNFRCLFNYNVNNFNFTLPIATWSICTTFSYFTQYIKGHKKDFENCVYVYVLLF